MSDQTNPEEIQATKETVEEVVVEATEVVAEAAEEVVAAVEEAVKAPVAAVAAAVADDDDDDDDDASVDYDEDDVPPASDDDDDDDSDDDDEEDDELAEVEGPSHFQPQQRQRRGFRASRQLQNELNLEDIHYKNIDLLSKFVDPRGRILSRRKTKISAKMQRRITTAIKRARHMALLPYTADHIRITRTGK